jgi:phage antirepressor YoqD-like protein
MPFADWPGEVTPKDIARALRISDKTLRQWLRDNRAAGHARYDRWIFTPREADEIVAAYRAARL